MSKTIKFELTEAEARTIIEHVKRDLEYGTGGTFGDEGKLLMREISNAERAVEKMKRAIEKD